MTKRRVLWLLAILIAVAGLALLVPNSPAYLPTLFGPGGSFHYHDGHSVSYWVKALESDDVKVRKQAVLALGTMGANAAEAVPALTVCLRKDDDGNVRGDAALSLSKMGAAAAPAVPSLIEALKDPDGYVRFNAAGALFHLKTASRPAIPALMEAVAADENKTNMNMFYSTIQAMAAQALGRASSGTAEAVPFLMKTLKSETTDGMRIAVARSLGEVGAEAGPAVPQLQELLRHKNIDVQMAAAYGLAGIGPEARAAVPQLQELAKNQDGLVKDVVQGAAEEALLKIEGKPAAAP